MRRIGAMLALFAVLPFALPAGEKKTPTEEYANFSRPVHSIVVKQLPKEFEDTSGWNLLIPLEPNLPLPKLRTVVKVDEKLMMPHGTWRRFKGKMEDPDKNLKIVVKEFKPINDKTYRFVAEVDATILCVGEIQQWQKGLFLIGGEAAADANFTATIVCDVGVSLNFKKFPPALNIEPKVSELTLNLVDVTVRNGPMLKGELAKGLASDFKEVLRGLVKASEPLVKDLANKAIEQSIKEGKGTISVDSIMKALPKSAKEDRKLESK